MTIFLRIAALVSAVGSLLGCSGSNGSAASQTTGGSSSGGQTSGGLSATGGSNAGTTGGNSTTGGAAPTVQATVTVSGANSSTVASTFFGQNYWSWVPAWGDPVAAIQTQVAAMGLNLLRAGGANNDQQNPVAFSQTEIDDFVAYAHAVGAEPLLQIPVLKNIAGTTATAQDAADVVTYTNKTNTYGVRYFSIGNEPDLYTSQGFQDASYSAVTFCNTYSAFAAAMKAVDPTIKIVGPDLSWMYQPGNDWLTPFLQNCGNVVDIVAVHRYPFTAAASLDTAAYADAASFRQTITSLRSIMTATGQGSKPLAITEANITWDGNPANPVVSASPQTFPAGLWVADSIGVGLEQGLFSINYWSMSEGYTLGFFAGTTPKPAYYVLQLFATKFGNQILTVTGAPSGVSVYAGRNASKAKSTVFVVNKTNNRVALTITLTSLPRSDSPVVTAEPISVLAAELPDDASAPTLTSYTSNMTQPAVVSN